MVAEVLPAGLHLGPASVAAFQENSLQSSGPWGHAKTVIRAFPYYCYYDYFCLCLLGPRNPSFSGIDT